MAMGSPLRATIDRFERDARGNRLAVLILDDGQQLVLPERLLPSGSRAKQVVRLSLQIDTAETDRRAAETENLQRELFGE